MPVRRGVAKDFPLFFRYVNNWGRGVCLKPHNLQKGFFYENLIVTDDVMSQMAWLTLNRHATTMPKRVIAPIKENVDVTEPLKISNKASTSENSKVDTIEISGTYKETDVSTEEKIDGLEDLVSYVRRRSLEIREMRPKNISYADMVAAAKSAPHTEEVEREEALAAKARPIQLKIRSGKTPTSEEMSFIKEHFPELYMDAKRIEQEMEQFRKQLSNCATKEEEKLLILQKKSQLMSEAKKRPGFVLSMMAAIDEELKNRNGKAYDGENGKADVAEIADTLTMISHDPANEGSRTNEKDTIKKPLNWQNTTTYHYEEIT